MVTHMRGKKYKYFLAGRKKTIFRKYISVLTIKIFFFPARPMKVAGINSDASNKWFSRRFQSAFYFTFVPYFHERA